MLERTPDIDIVLVDIMMPVMDGYATMRAMRELPSTGGPADHRRHGEGRSRRAPALHRRGRLRLRLQARRERPRLPARCSAEWLPAAPRRATVRSARLTAAEGRLDLAGAAEPAAVLLVVDDNAAKRLAIRAMLAPLGHAVVEADSGRAALRAVLQQTFAVILMDVRMPTLDGYETAKLIRQRSQSELTPIIFVTAFGRDETETAGAYASGAVDFIFTPILADVLRAKVSAFVALFVQAQELQRSLESITALNVALRDSEVRARAVLQNVADGIVTAGEEGLIESFNRSAQRLFGYREDEVIGQPLQLIVAPGHHEEFSDPARARWSLLAAADIPAEPTETVGCRKDGSCFPMEMDMSQMQIGERTFTIGCIRDISGRKAYTDALEHRALHDELTGLPNRTLFGDRMDRALAAADRADEPRGVLLIDLDEFRHINEALGREKGDALLQAVAERLARRDARLRHRGPPRRRRVRHPPAGRHGRGAGRGDRVEDPRGVRAAVPRRRRGPRRAGEHRHRLLPAARPRHRRPAAPCRPGDAPGQAVAAAALAVFVAEPEDQTARRLTLLSELRDGIPRGELVLHYQPKVDLATRRTTGVEALVRWQHPTDGLLMPAQFMPEAERSELIEPLTSWVLDAALQQQRALDATPASTSRWRSTSRRAASRAAVDLPDTVASLTEPGASPPAR